MLFRQTVCWGGGGRFKTLKHHRSTIKSGAERPIRNHMTSSPPPSPSTIIVSCHTQSTTQTDAKNRAKKLSQPDNVRSIVRFSRGRRQIGIERVTSGACTSVSSAAAGADVTRRDEMCQHQTRATQKTSTHSSSSNVQSSLQHCKSCYKYNTTLPVRCTHASDKVSTGQRSRTRSTTFTGGTKTEGPTWVVRVPCHARTRSHHITCTHMHTHTP